MIKVIIIFAPDNRVYKDIADFIKNSFDKKKYSVTIKSARKALITDLSTADLVILGSQESENKALHTDFSEIVRALQGINLSSRLCGLFTINSTGIITKIKKNLKDCNITIFKEALVLSSDFNETAITTWISGLMSVYEENFYG